MADKSGVTGVPPCGSAAGFALGSGQTLSTLRLRKSHLIKWKNICHEWSAFSRGKQGGDKDKWAERLLLFKDPKSQMNQNEAIKTCCACYSGLCISKTSCLHRLSFCLSSSNLICAFSLFCVSISVLIDGQLLKSNGNIFCEWLSTVKNKKHQNVFSCYLSCIWNIYQFIINYIFLYLLL